MLAPESVLLIRAPGAVGLCASARVWTAELLLGSVSIASCCSREQALDRLLA